MRVLFDFQIFDEQKYGGASRYFFELLYHLQAEGNIDWELPVRYSQNEYLKTLPGVMDRIEDRAPDPYQAFLGGTSFKGKGKVFSLYSKFFPVKNFIEQNRDISVKKILAHDFEIFHPTYYDPYFLQLIGKKPYVLTVFDMIHEIFPEFFLNDMVSYVKRELVIKASKIIAISQSTKNDLIKLFNVNPEKIEVVYLGNSLVPIHYTENKQFEDSLPEKYILYVGQRGLYKNFYFFIQAILPLLEKDPDLKVVCTGREFNYYEIALFKGYKVHEQMIHHYADDIKLAGLYKNAQAFVFPSLYEGFGIPILEAFACGCPVIASNTSSLPEVGGDAVVYFEPKDALSIRDSLQYVLYNKDVKERLVNKGYKQLQKFSWVKTAKETGDVYRSVLQ